MTTYMSWDSSVVNDTKVIRQFPDTSFECPKLNQGDLISLDIAQLKGPHILTPVKVVQVSASISLDVFRNSKDACMRDVEQYLFVEPVVFERVENT